MKVQHSDTQAIFEKLFAFSPDAIVVVDREGRILKANPRVESLFGYVCSELLGSSIEILIPDRFRSVHQSHLKAYCDQPLMRPMGTGLELCGRRKDGNEFPVDIMVSPVETAEGLIVLAVIRDITERKHLEEEMRQLASSDPLTGLGNYRRLKDAFETEIKWFHRTRRSAALLLFDLDGLKQINDIHGHIVVAVRCAVWLKSSEPSAVLSTQRHVTEGMNSLSSCPIRTPKVRGTSLTASRLDLRTTAGTLEFQSVMESASIRVMGRPCTKFLRLPTANSRR